MKSREPQSAAARPPRAIRVAKQINWRVCVDRSQAGTAAREAHLRSLMGLPATAARDVDKERGR
jgi:hypothetical protein